MQGDDDEFLYDLPAWMLPWPDLAPELLPWNGQKALQQILDGPRTGEVCGVSFDLTDPRLPSTDHWHAPSGSIPFGIAFPWDRAVHGGDLARTELEVTGGGSLRGWETTHVYEGDRVTVERVGVRNQGGVRPPLVDEHDALVFEAYLEIQRADGSIATPDQPFEYVARDGMGPHIEATLPESDGEGYREYLQHHTVSFEKVGLRIARLQQRQVPHSLKDWLELASAAHKEALSLADEMGSDGQAPFPELPCILDAAVAAGYALAKAEAGPVLSLAKRGIKADESQKAATRGSRSRADPVRAYADELIRRHPNISQTQCARLIAKELNREQRQVERLIRDKFEWRDGTTGVREKRPKRPPGQPRQIVD